MAQNTATFTIEDYSKEKSSMQINVGPITVANFAALRDALDNLKNVMDNLIIGELRKTTISEQFAESAAAVTDPNAQRERKWLVSYRDVTQFFDVGNTINNVGFGNIYTVEIPTAKASLLSTESDDLDLSLPAVAAWVTAFEAVQNSPTGGNEIEVVSIKHVGRSS